MDMAEEFCAAPEKCKNDDPICFNSFELTADEVIARNRGLAAITGSTRLILNF